MRKRQEQLSSHPENLLKNKASIFFSLDPILCLEGLGGRNVMNIKWDYNYYQPWSDNEWLVDEILAMQDKDIIMQ